MAIIFPIPGFPKAGFFPALDEDGNIMKQTPQVSPQTAPGVPLPASPPNTSGSGSSPGNAAPSRKPTGGPKPSIVDDRYTSKIKSTLLRPALTSHYICRFFPDSLDLQNFLKIGNFPGSDYQNLSNQELIELSCTEASLPGSSLMTNEINDDYTGVTERFAYRRQYDDRIDFTFYVDHDYRIINFFERWISYCVGENLQSSLDDRTYTYRVNFPESYQTDSLYVVKFERDVYDKPSLEYKFIGAYPISIASMPVSYDSSQLLKCTVSFSYIRYVRTVVQPQKLRFINASDFSENQVTVEFLDSNGNLIRKIITREEYNKLYAPR